MSPKNWLKQFLTSRQLTCPSGQALYRNRLSYSEFEALKSALKTTALFGVANITEISGWNAACVIYAAEWWRQYMDLGKGFHYWVAMNPPFPGIRQLYDDTSLPLQIGFAGFIPL